MDILNAMAITSTFLKCPGKYEIKTTFGENKKLSIRATVNIFLPVHVASTL